MYQYSNSLIRQFPSQVTGNAAVGIQAIVYVGETNVIAQLFEVGGAAKSNPVTTDAKGFYSFSVADGDYRIVFSNSQFATLRISVLDGVAIREEFDGLVASNTAFRNKQQAAYDSFVLSQGWDQIGTFAAGFTFTSPNQVGQDVGGNWWRWNGALPKTVTAGTLPSSDANYKLVGDGVLRNDLADGSAVIGGQTAAYLAESAERFANLGIFNIKDYGALVDGITDDTAAIQVAMHAAIAAGGGTVFFPYGVCIATQLNIEPGIKYAGTGSSWIKRPANQPNFTRTFTTQGNPWNSTADSPLLHITGLSFDGNRDNQGAYSAYQQEQSHLLFLTGLADKAGRLRVLVNNCLFMNSVADGVSQFTNVDLAIDNCFMTNCFRGGIVLTGGFSRLRASNIAIKGEVNSRGIDFETDGGGFGGSVDVVAELVNIEVPAHFDVGASGNSRIVATNITYGDISAQRSFNVSADGNASVKISNSDFLIAAGALNQFRFVKNIKMDNCTFTLTNFGSVTGTNIGIVVYANDKRNLELSNVEFKLAPDANLTDNFYPLQHTAGNKADHNTFLNNCKFGAGIDIGILAFQGGLVKASNCFFDSTTGIVFGGGGTYTSETLLVDCEYGAGNTFQWNNDANNAVTSLYVSGRIDAAKYNFSGVGGNSWFYQSDLVVFGAQLNPNSPAVKGMPNDTYKTSALVGYAAGSAVFYVGSATASAPFFEWVPVKRD